MRQRNPDIKIGTHGEIVYNSEYPQPVILLRNYTLY